MCGRQDARGRVVRVEEGVVVDHVQVEGAVVFVERWEGTPGPSDGCTHTLSTRGSSLEAR